MARTTGVVHVAYLTHSTTGTVAIDPAQIRLHGSKLAALEDAVERSARYVPWKHGQTLNEAIDDYERSKVKTPKSASSSTPKASDS